jgi:hypothetical protein
MSSTTSGVKSFPKIKAIKTFLIQGVGSGGDYHNVKGGHWLIDSKIATPMSHYPQYQKSRTDFGINVLGSFCVEIQATDGSKGFATGFGGPPACWLTEEHFKRFLIGAGVYHAMSSCGRGLANHYYQIPETPTTCSNRCTELPCSMAARVCQLQSSL